MVTPFKAAQSTPPKTTLRELRRDYNARTGKELTSMDIAEDAGVELGREWAIEIGGNTTEGDARTVLAAYARITGERVTIDDIALKIKPEKPDLKLLCLRHNVTMVGLSRVTGLQVGAIWPMIHNQPVSQNTALVILDGLNRLAGTSYHIHDLRVAFLIQG